MNRINGRVSWSFIAWAPFSRRSEGFAKTFDGNLHCIHYLRYQTPVYALPKYVLQAIRTLQVLFTERPQVVHVQNPPVICGLVVSLYCLATRTQFVLDHHSAAFGPAWRWALPLQKLLARRAVTNLVTTQHASNIIHSWGAQTMIMGDPIMDLPHGEVFPTGSKFNIVFVGTYAPDEPLDEVLSAAAELPQVQIHITGDLKRKPQSFMASIPVNVSCTGFLPDNQFIGLLRAADSIMALTTRDYTIQSGGAEAVAVGQPLITSNWSTLRESFPKGTVYVDNTTKGIRDGILTMMKEHTRLKREIVQLRDEKRQEWDDASAQLSELVMHSLNGNHSLD